MNAAELQSWISTRREGATLRILNDPYPWNVEIKKQWNVVIEKAGFQPADWLEEIDLPTAKKVLLSFLHRNMAYPSCRYLPLDQAEGLAVRFFGLFPLETRFFTNGRFNEWTEPETGCQLLQLKSWNCITQSTFEAGVIALSPAVQGILWFEDED